MNPKWTIQAKASLAKYFSDLAGTLEVAFTTDALENQKAIQADNFIFFRVQIDCNQMTGSEWRLKAGVELLFHFKRAEIFEGEVLKGQVIQAMSACIPFLDIGYDSKTGDTVGFFQLQKVRDPIRTLTLTTKADAVEIVFTAPYEITLTP